MRRGHEPSPTAWDAAAASFHPRTASLQALIATHHPGMPTHSPVTHLGGFYKGQVSGLSQEEKQP